MKGECYGIIFKIRYRKKLGEIYIPMFQTMMGMSKSQAKSTFRQLLKQAKKDSEIEGTSNLPLNYGDIRLEKESTNEAIKSILTKVRNEGATNEDIRWWWNMHDLERRMMVAVDEISRMALFTKCLEEGMKESEAAAKVRKHHPIFGDPDDNTHTTGNDRPLPIELKDRINIYVERRSETDPQQFKRAIEESSSVNALIRKEIEKGNI